MYKTCDNCRHGAICRLTSGLWEYYRETLQGKVKESPNCMAKMINILASYCHHWEEYEKE